MFLCPGKLAHCGRTGVSGGVRYIAHEGGLAAEYMTPLVLSNYAAVNQPKPKPKKGMTYTMCVFMTFQIRLKINV